jgi:hypothetical protein
MAIGDTDLAVTGRVTAGNIAMGSVLITPVADTVTSHIVSGLNLQGTGDIIIMLSPRTVVPGTTFKQVTYSNESSTQFEIFVLRTNTTATRIHWLAWRMP